MKRIIDGIERNYTHKLDLQMFADDNGGGSDSEGQTQNNDNSAPEVRKIELTQEEFDAKIAERLARERKKYADYDDLKAKLAEYEAAEEERKKAAMTEQERIQAELEAAKKAAQEAEDARKQALEAANQRAIKAEFKLAAADVNIRKDAIEDAFILIDKSGISVDEDGNVIGVKEALEALIAAKPYLVETTKPKKIGEPNNPKSNGEKTKEQLLAEAAEKARKSGRLEDLAAYTKLKRELL